jgi:hypothetical protein
MILLLSDMRRELRPEGLPPGQGGLKIAKALVVQLVFGFETPTVVGSPVAASDFGEEDRGLGGLPLAEQHRLVAIRRLSGPVRQELASVGGDAVPVVRAPPFDFAADVVDQRILLPALPRDDGPFC